MIDPPWPQDVSVGFRGWRSHGIGFKPVSTVTRDNKKKYKTMPLQQIHDIKLPCDTNCHVFLWVTPRFVHEGFHVLESWNVKYHDIITWHKAVAGMPAGNIRRFTEFILCGYVGKFERIKKPLPAIFRTYTLPKRHSEKPSQFYRYIVERYPGPRLDMFARKRHFGFDCVGDQTEEQYTQYTIEDMI